MSKARSKKHRDLLIESLKNPKEALAYLNAIVEEAKDGSAESQTFLLTALKDIAEAQGGIAKLSEKTSLGRESLYKALSKKGNPKLTTLTTVINAIGFDMRFHMPAKR